MENQIIARLAALEALTMATLGVYFANARNDPNYDLAKAWLDALRSDAVAGFQALPPPIRDEATAYLDSLLGQVAKSLPILRGESSGQAH